MNTQMLPYSNSTQLGFVVRSFRFDVLSKIESSLTSFESYLQVDTNVVDAARMQVSQYHQAIRSAANIWVEGPS